MAEWLKAHAWKACLGETLTRVRYEVSGSSPRHLPAKSLRGCLGDEFFLEFGFEDEGDSFGGIQSHEVYSLERVQKNRQRVNF